jgi:uncharacterized protein YprB with RNaseH-like and TPR domain
MPRRGEDGPGRADDRAVTGGGSRVAIGAEPTLPPPGGDPARLLALSGDLVATHHHDTVTALLDEFEPDAVVATPPRAGTVDAALRPEVGVPVLSPARSHRPESVTTDDEIRVTTVPAGTDALTADDAASDGDGTEPHRVCLTTRISLDVDPYERRTAIEGLDGYRAALPAGWLGGGNTHCSTALRAGYRATVTVDGASCSLVGIGRPETTLGVGVDDGDTRDATLVAVYRNGAVDVETVAPGSVGLRGIDGVGERRAETLRRAGYETPTDVADAPPHELADLPGMGRSAAAAIRAAAEARADGTVVATGDDPLPYGEPVFVDVETDGLEPSCVWLVGVLDGGAADGRYLAFEESEPGDGGHLEAFLNWLQANAGGRPLVAWNGYDFDFPVLTDQIRRHRPGYADAWEDVYRFDALWWARDKNGGNAALPGRTNELGTVAEALGWRPRTTGLDGGSVARVYSAYRRAYLAAETPRTVTEPDWERLRRYCEDDVRALATVYDALSDAARRDPGSTARTQDGGTQGALSDFT